MYISNELLHTTWQNYTKDLFTFSSKDLQEFENCPRVDVVIDVENIIKNTVEGGNLYLNLQRFLSEINTLGKIKKTRIRVLYTSFGEEYYENISMFLSYIETNFPNIQLIGLEFTEKISSKLERDFILVDLCINNRVPIISLQNFQNITINFSEYLSMQYKIDNYLENQSTSSDMANKIYNEAIQISLQLNHFIKVMNLLNKDSQNLISHISLIQTLKLLKNDRFQFNSDPATRFKPLSTDWYNFYDNNNLPYVIDNQTVGLLHTPNQVNKRLEKFRIEPKEIEEEKEIWMKTIKQHKQHVDDKEGNWKKAIKQSMKNVVDKATTVNLPIETSKQKESPSMQEEVFL